MPSIDWPQVIESLKSSGMTQAEIAQHCNVSQAAIQQLNAGKTKEPKHSIGERLIYLMVRSNISKQKAPSGN